MLHFDPWFVPNWRFAHRSHPALCPLEEKEPLEFGEIEDSSFGSEGDLNPLGFDFQGLISTHRFPYNGDPAQLPSKKKRRPQILDQDLGLKARSVLTDQALALKEDRRRTNSL